MQKSVQNPRSRANLAGAVTFIGIFVLILLIALMNAPTQGGPRVMANLGTYLQAVKASAIPFLIAVAIGAAILGGFAGMMVRRVWPHPQQRREMVAGYLFLAPYLLVTLVFTVGVIFFAFYISFTHYNIFQSPVWVGLQNYGQAFAGFFNPIQKLFVESR